MKKSIITLFTIFCLLFTVNKVFAVDINSKYYGVYNVDNDTLLIGNNTKDKIAIASMTKLMTGIIACENIEDINSKIVIDLSKINGKVDEELATIGIYDKEVLSYYDLIATMLVGSAADSAVYLQNTLFETPDEFISKMNEKAKEIGMNNTNFSNVTGLDDDNNYSTIEDVSKMIIYALNNSTLKEILEMKSYTTTDNNLVAYSTIFSRATRNNMEIKHILGGKTGTTENAGLCLASFASDDEDSKSLVAVVAGSSMYSNAPYNIIDSENLYDFVVNNFSNKNIVTKGDKILTLNTINSKEDTIDFYADKDLKKYISDVDKNKIQYEYNGQDIITPFTRKGTKLGILNVYYDNEFIGTYDIVFNSKLHFSIIKWIRNNKITAIIITIFILLIIRIIISRKSKRKNNNKITKKPVS